MYSIKIFLFIFPSIFVKSGHQICQIKIKNGSTILVKFSNVKFHESCPAIRELLYEYRGKVRPREGRAVMGTKMVEQSVEGRKEDRIEYTKERGFRCNL